MADGIYQIRRVRDIANMTLVEGASGWIVIDTLLTEDMARAGLKLAMDTLKSRKPVVAGDHHAQLMPTTSASRGVVDEADVRSGKVPLIVPRRVHDHTVAENVLAAMR